MPTSHVSYFRCLPALLLALQLTACAYQSTPQLDQRFGDAVRLAMAQQVLYPAAARNQAPANGLDGPSARAVMDRYRASFVEPNGQVAQPVQFMLGGGSGK
ncbi:hypothetical protein [Janthinobacterium sp.]|uniref:hypothetical protein n=1 Tax=Janthinobacterium sp. TaxID=1871054 RepID=UPI00263476B2|nr:hypothetical protein [Janthinobacterium sp.]